jgi:hypothetical protein
MLAAACSSLAAVCGKQGSLGLLEVWGRKDFFSFLYFVNESCSDFTNNVVTLQTILSHCKQ